MLGKMRLQNILSAHVRQLYKRVQSDGKDARTIQLVHVTLHIGFAQAVKDRVPGRNPAAAVDRPEAEPAEHRTLTEAQASQFLIVPAGTDDGMSRSIID